MEFSNVDLTKDSNDDLTKDIELKPKGTESKLTMKEFGLKGLKGFSGFLKIGANAFSLPAQVVAIPLALIPTLGVLAGASIYKGVKGDDYTWSRVSELTKTVFQYTLLGSTAFTTGFGVGVYGITLVSLLLGSAASGIDLYLEKEHGKKPVFGESNILSNSNLLTTKLLKAFAPKNSILYPSYSFGSASQISSSSSSGKKEEESSVWKRLGDSEQKDLVNHLDKSKFLRKLEYFSLTKHGEGEEWHEWGSRFDFVDKFFPSLDAGLKEELIDNNDEFNKFNAKIKEEIEKAEKETPLSCSQKSEVEEEASLDSSQEITQEPWSMWGKSGVPTSSTQEMDDEPVTISNFDPNITKLNELIEAIPQVKDKDGTIPSVQRLLFVGEVTKFLNGIPGLEGLKTKLQYVHPEEGSDRKPIETAEQFKEFLEEVHTKIQDPSEQPAPASSSPSIALTHEEELEDIKKDVEKAPISNIAGRQPIKGEQRLAIQFKLSNLLKKVDAVELRNELLSPEKIPQTKEQFLNYIARIEDPKIIPFWQAK